VAASFVCPQLKRDSLGGTSLETSMRLWPLKVAMSGGAVGVIILRILWPELRLDAVTLGLLLLAVLPWLSPLIKSAEFPGGWKIELQEVKEAGDRITASAPQSSAKKLMEFQGYAPTVTVSPADPNLGLVGVRIEIEKRLRSLAESAGIPLDQSALRLARSLHQKGIVNEDELAGLRQLIEAGNRAAHGAPVAPDVSAWVDDYAPEVLAALDAKRSR